MPAGIRTTSDLLHNYNCYAYFKKIKVAPGILNSLPDDLKLFLDSMHTTDYDSHFAYGDLYTRFFSYIEDNIVELYDKPREKLISNLNAEITKPLEHFSENSYEKNFIKLARGSKESNQNKLQALDEFILSLYDNDNNILPQTFEAIKNITFEKTPASKDLQKLVSKHVKDEKVRVNKQSQSPAQAGSAYGRFTALMTNNFKTQHTTSLATVRHYDSQNPKSFKEYRFGTQGQRHNGEPRVSPLFKRYLAVREYQDNNSDKINHIYFNNLGWDRKDTEGKKEAALTEVLHKLEEEHPNIAVITLPADKGYFSQQDYKKTEDKHEKQAVYEKFLVIANAHRNPTGSFQHSDSIEDFYISERVRALLFPNGTQEIKLKELLDKSFAQLGLDKPFLSSAERQAVWFHFIKFELTNHIINTIQPDGVNFSCKDAIDRGGVSSGYYNLIGSFEAGTPMTREEFEQALHAAPTMVKGRGMNHQIKLIWNTVDAYINANYHSIKNDPNKAWLIQWRDFNCPHARVEQLLNQRIVQCQEELTAAKLTNPQKLAQIEHGLKIINNISIQTEMNVSGKRLLLEAVVRTPEVILNPDNQDNLQKYHSLAGKLTINYGFLQTLAGTMKALLALVLYIPSFKKSKTLFQQGIATANAGLIADSGRAILVSGMKQCSEELSKEIEDPSRSLEESSPAIKIK